MAELNRKLQRNPSPAIRARVIATDCAEMPCMSVLALDGLASPREPGQLDVADPMDGQRRSIEMLKKADAYYRSAVESELREYFRGAVPYWQASIIGDQVKIALSALPRDAPPSGEGQPVTVDAELQRQVQRRMAVRLR
jgi:hypothetical protein